LSKTQTKSCEIVRLGDSVNEAAESKAYLLQTILGEPEFEPVIEVLRSDLLKAPAINETEQFCNWVAEQLLTLLARSENKSLAAPLEKAYLHSKFFAQRARTQSGLQVEQLPSASRWCVNPPPSGRQLTTDLPFFSHSPLITEATPIGAAGSCFAAEITHYLRSKNYNFVITEENEHSCAAWGALYNAPSFRQLVEFAFGLHKRPSLLFECEDTGKKEFWDPFREGIFFNSIEEFEDSTRRHTEAAKEALLRAKVFIMTIGLNEVWRLVYDNSVLARYPRTLASHLVRKQLLTVNENVRELQRMLDVWRFFNPDIKIIITVSPVPLYATFRAAESHVIASTCHSKSVLRLAVNQFVKQNPGRVFYFPAFEVVSYSAPEPWTDDCRHVTRETVATVMSLFERTFLELSPSV
jgi:hypothetical protein